MLDIEHPDRAVFERPLVFHLAIAAISLGALFGLGWAARAAESGSFARYAANSLSLIALAIAVTSVVAVFLRGRIEIDDQGIAQRGLGKEQRVEWSSVSPFSETEPTHREGDEHCFLKSPGGDVLMAVAPHLVGGRKRDLLREIRQRIGPPALPTDGRPEVFRYGDFGPAPAMEFRLCPEALVLVSPAEEVKIPYEEVERIEIKAWPRIGTGMERTLIFVDANFVEVDSRLIGFWPFMDYLASRCPQTEIEDESRRLRLRSTRETGALQESLK